MVLPEQKMTSKGQTANHSSPITHDTFRFLHDSQEKALFLGMLDRFL